MNSIQKRKQDLNKDLYVDMVHQWKSQRPRRPRCNVIRFPATPEQQPQEEPTPCGLTVGGAAVILLSLLSLSAVLILLGVTG